MYKLIGGGGGPKLVNYKDGPKVLCHLTLKKNMNSKIVLMLSENVQKEF